MTAADFVRGALAEVGHSEVGAFVYTNRRGDPSFRWRDMDGYPTSEQVEAVIQAFDLWYRRQPINDPDIEWLGRQPGDVGRWLDLMYAVGGW